MTERAGRTSRIVVLFCWALLSAISCSRDGGETVIIELPASTSLPSATAPLLANPPGKGTNAGPASYTFWSKNRKAAGPAGLAAYSQITADKLAFSPHFVLYRDRSTAALMNAEQAATYVYYLEGRYAALKQIYGDDIFPDLQQTGRIVILALDIQDDFSTAGSAFVSGYFAPRDLFNDAYTSGLFTNAALIQTVSAETLAERAGRSNMLPMVYADLRPFFNADAFGGDITKAENLFREMLLHEASHLFTYYSRHIARQLPALPVFIAEGLAENAPMLVDNRFEGMQLRLADFSDPIVQNDLKLPVTLAQFTQNNSERTGYVRSNLFFSYLRHRAGNAAAAGSLYRQIVAGGGDFAALGNQIAAGGIAAGFSAVYYDFVLSLFVASGAYNITAYHNTGGAPLDLNTGAPLTLKQSLGFSFAGISNYNQGTVAFQPSLGKAPLPAAYSASQCLPPLSFQIYPYYTTSGDTFTPTDLGTDGNLKIILLKNPDTQVFNVELRRYAATEEISLAASTISGSTIQNLYHIILINDQTSGGCLSPGNLPRNLNEGNLTSWIGAGLTGWQSNPGAANGNRSEDFLRTAGMATNFAHPERSGNYIYIADYLSHKVSRWNINTGAFAGALGDRTLPSTNIGCVGDTSGSDGFKTEGRTYQNYCRRSFNSPRGLAVTSRGDIVIADTDNHRLVLYDAAGNFVAWLGDATTDLWQCANAESHPFCGVAGNAPVSPFNIPGAGTQANMFYYPWNVSVDEAGATKYIYVTSYGSSRVIRRNLETGAFAGIIGNGYDAWYTGAASIPGVPGVARKYLNSPMGITHDETYIYISDTNNHRISRYTRAGIQADAADDTTKVFLGGTASSWHDGATPFGTGEGSFTYPTSLTLAELDGVDGNTYRFLVVSDAGNHRLSRFALRSHEKLNPANITWNTAIKGWLGAGFLAWQSGANGYNYNGISSSLLFPPEFIYSPQAAIFVPASSSGLARDYLFVTTTYSARVSRWNMNCLWQQNELTIFTRNCGGEP